MKLLNFLFFLLFSSNCILTPFMNTNGESSDGKSFIQLMLSAIGVSIGGAQNLVPAGGGVATMSGTSIRSSDGMITIDIPEGAVTETVAFTIEKYTPATNSYPGSYIPTSFSYEITPSYRFKKPVTVSMSLDTSTIQSLNLTKAKSLGFSYSRTSVSEDSGRFPSWMAHETNVVGDKVVFNTQTFSIFGIATPPPGNQPPINLGAFYYFKAGCDYLPYSLRSRVVDPDGDTLQVYLITGPANGGSVAIPMTREGTTDWYAANIPYEAMSSSGIQMQISASDSFGQTSLVPSTGVFNYPASSNNTLYITNYDRDKDNDGLLCAWERDNGKSDTNASDASGVTDTDGDGIPNGSDYTPNGEGNPTIDSLQIFPANVSLDLTEKVIFGVSASFGGSPRYVNANFVTTGIGLGGGAVGTMNMSTFTPSVPGAAGIVASVGVFNVTATAVVADTLGPNNITTLVANPIASNKIQLQWLAPGDDNQFGRAVTYQIFRSTNVISNNNNCNGILINHTLTPKIAGVMEKLDVGGLTPDTLYYFCIRAVDDNGNFNQWNGTVSAKTYTTPDMVPPADIVSVTATSLGIDKIQLNWTAVGDDGNLGSAQSYEIFRSTSPILTDTQCRSAVLVPNTVASNPSGTPLSFTVSNLGDNTVYYFCIVAVDESNNYSTWNGMTTATTLRKNLPPNITLSDTLSGVLPDSVVLNASLSGDPDAVACGANASNYIYSWSVLNKPPTSLISTTSITGGNTKVASFTPDVPGDYTVLFSFTDDKGSCGGTNSLNVKSVVITITRPSGVKQWTRLFGFDPGGIVGNGGVTSDANGNVYAIGDTNVSVDGQTLTGTIDFILVKSNSNGVKQWTRILGVAGKQTTGWYVATDTNGYVYASGQTSGNLDGQTLNGTFDAFIIKYDTNGSKFWTRLLGGAGKETFGRGITSDSNGNIYATGFTDSSLDGQPITGTRDMLIVKYNDAGVKQWTRLLGVAGQQTLGISITSDSNGNVYSTGNAYGNLDGQTIVGSPDLFVVKYNANGIKQWTKLLGVAGAATYAKGITSDSNGNIYITGFTYGNLDGQVKTGGADTFVVKYDSNGIKQWTRLLGVANQQTQANGITSDPDGNIYTSGNTSGNLDGQTKSGSLDLFLTKYDSNGIKQWTRLLGLSGAMTRGIGVTSDANGNLYCSGTTNGNLDGQTKTSPVDLFMVKYW
ncbi:SBBP repeat-containing protein [Leptospira paudalimensis]|uniref:SBBP repeat-containing protein n=1 Tax=Leptospira paudalimensis TaxID=2950024 RepID=A0ABT3MB13_9LEPT|nr:SBBP repeat-containing protein [Leptospira paudalimensis]MCW7505581.1 SBBP repeat-containing protein [Leptospira paudalimensis]